ncbi:uncharacterized protein C2orf72 isoform X2 [Camelus bactrianus]|uniref:Uncharacterized protein C2orf72 isoform X2 n=1 Tax=Camelus bactrianus TaxID=9837 RepID=A0AC58QE62_CAMBA
MERELEALAARPARPAEPPFQALVEAAGGCGQVLLVGELWEREQSRALLWDFARAVFPPQRAAGKPGGAAAEGAEPGAPGAQKALRTGAARAIRSPLVFVLCRASSLAAREPRRHLREMLRDVRGRRRAGAALVGVLVAEAEAEDSVVPELRLLEALLRTVFGRQAGGPVQAVAYCPGHPASSLAVQAAACRALQAAGPARPELDFLLQKTFPDPPCSHLQVHKRNPRICFCSPSSYHVVLSLSLKEPGTDLASQHCWHAFPGVPGAGGRTQMPPPSVAQLRITSRTLRRSWH